MDLNKEIYLPDTCVKLSVLKRVLKEVYDIEIKTNKNMTTTGYCVIITTPKNSEQVTSQVMPTYEAGGWLHKNCPNDCDYEVHTCDEHGNNKNIHTKFADGGFVELKQDKHGNNWLFPKGANKKTYGIQMMQGGEIKKAEELKLKYAELKAQRDAILRADGMANFTTRRLNRELTKLEAQIKKYDNGGNVEEEEYNPENDLFLQLEEKRDEIPDIVIKIINRHQENWDETYENCQALQQELESVGYTIDYGLDAVPYNLRKIEMAKEGGVEDSYNIKNIKIGDRIKDKYNNEAEVWYNDGEKIEAQYISGASYVYKQKDFDNGEVRFLWGNRNIMKKGGGVGEGYALSNKELIKKSTITNTSIQDIYNMISEIDDIDSIQEIGIIISRKDWSNRIQFPVKQRIYKEIKSKINDKQVVKDLRDLMKTKKFSTGGGIGEEDLQVKNASKIRKLEQERKQLLMDMEQEAEPEGGPIADSYGKKLNAIDKKIKLLKYGKKELTYEQVIEQRKNNKMETGGGVGKKKKTDFTIGEFIQLERDKLKKHNAQAHEDDRLDWSDWKSELTNKDTQQYGIYYNSRMIDQNGDRGVFEYLPTNKNYREDDFETGGNIPERYKQMGFTRVGEKKNSTNPEKKWMVLAKKGDQYKVVHGGYKGMEDYTQHHDEKRRKRFWQRMGGINSAKANDPFSPLYWHKKFGTWEQGGEIPKDSDYVIDAKPRVIEEEQINEGAIELSNKPTKKQPAKKQDSVREIKLKLEDVNIPTKTITGSIDVFNFLKEIWDMDTINIQEDFCVLYLNRANRVISYQKLSRGGISGVVADIEIIVATASKALAKGVIIAHNHPSGNLKPSQEDIKLTQNLKQALKLIDISLLDSLIVTPQNAYYSLADEGLMYGLGGYIKRKNKFIQDKVKKVVKEFSLGKLKTSAGKKVKDIKQALAIGYSEGRTGWKHKRKK